MERSGSMRKIAGLAAALALVAGACSCDDEDGAPPTTVPPTGQPAVGGPLIGSGGESDVAVLGVRLSEGAPVASPGAVVPAAVDGTPLSAAAIDALLTRLGDWDVPDDDRADFARPAETLAPPTVAEQVEGTFPPDAPIGSDVPAPAEGPLDVLRIQPEGEVALAPFFSVTFNEPMVELATLERLDAIDSADLPVELAPDVEGRWRWIGTRTLRFEVEPGATDRLPAATEYTITVPAGTESVNGAVLADTVEQTFATPAPSVASMVGVTRSMPLEPVLVAVFDQRVDPDAVLATVTLDADGERALRIATAAEIDADDAARAAMSQALPDRAVAFRPVEPLPTDTALEVVIGPGTPSAEGPRTSTEPARFDGRTYPPMRVTRVSCGWGDECPPGTSFVLEFTNELDRAAFDASQIGVTPALAGLRIDVFGNTVEIRGATEPRTPYTITARAGITDVFGQALAEDRTVERTIGDAPPLFAGPQLPVVTTDPFAESPSIEVTSVRHERLSVTAWAVTAEQFGEFAAYFETQWSDAEAADPDWPVVAAFTADVDGDPDRLTRTVIDLGDAFAESGAFLVVRIEPDPPVSPRDDQWWQNRASISWVQATELAVDAVYAEDEVLIWTTDLRTGAPLGGVEVAVYDGGESPRSAVERRVVATVTTDTDGLARYQPPAGDGLAVGALVARSDDDEVLLGEPWGVWNRWQREDEARFSTFDDRGVYRPGETMRMAGWVRNVSGDDLDLELFDGDLTVTATTRDPQGVELASDEVPVNALGGFNLTVEIPEGANLGFASVELQLNGATNTDAGWLGGDHRFQIQEFRTPEFEVTARSESPGPYLAARPATVAVDAEYFAGGPLPSADVDWIVSTRQGTYSPPNWDDYTFGIWIPWWLGGGWWEGDVARDVAYGSFDEPCFDCPPFGQERVERFSGTTDASGTHYLQIDFTDPGGTGGDDGDGPAVDLPTVVTADATVYDVNRQAWSSRTDLLVHAAALYVGARTDRAFVKQGEPLRVDLVVADIDGAAVGDRTVEVVAGRLDYEIDADGVWREVVVDEQRCSITSTADVPDAPPAPADADASMRCEFTTDVGGQYRITATVVDDDGRTNRTELTQWVAGSDASSSLRVERDQLTIVPDREEYIAGDTAEVFVQASFAPATALVTTTRAGIEDTQVVDAQDGSAVIEIAIEDRHVPNVNVSIEMVGSTVRLADDGTPIDGAPPRPAFGSGQVVLPVSTDSRRLDVVATPVADAVEPGVSTSVAVAVTDPDGAPAVGAQVAVVVVDEAVLAVTGYQLPDPLSVFYRPVWPNVGSQLLRSTLLLDRAAGLPATGDGDDGAAEESAASDDAGGADFEVPQAAPADRATVGDEAGATIPIDVRSDFDALAVFAPEETTGADGTVTVEVDLPDNLTRYRVMAVAVDGARLFGSGEANLTARLPLMVRPSAPRFANFGDRFELPVVLQNQTDEAMDVDLVVQTSNLELPDAVVDGDTPATGVAVTVPANDRIEVRFATTVEDVGTARFRVGATSGSLADAAAGEIPVYTPSTAEAFATYGVVDESGAGGAVGQPVLAPEGVYPQFGGLEIGTSSTVLQSLTDAVIDIVDYRYPNPDGDATRLLTIVSLRDVLAAFQSPQLPSDAELRTAVMDSIDSLVELQNTDGGWAWWVRGTPSQPWTSIAATHALVVARDAGETVPADTVAAALGFLAEIEERIDAELDQTTKDTISAYALHVRELAGQADVAKAETLFERAGDDLQVDAVAWLWPTLADTAADAEIARRIDNAAVETPSAATFATSYGEDAYVIAHSDARTDGIVLEALLDQRPDSDLIVKTVNGLLANQRSGRWGNVYENTFVLLAMKQYFDTFEATAPDFTARAWLGDLYAVEDDFTAASGEGRSIETITTVVPMAELIAAGDSTVIVAKDGSGRLYYRLGLRYAPDDLQLPPRDEGFVVDRTYEAVDDPADVVRNADGTWSVKAGATVRVTLTMVADARRTNMALVDHLPAGFEPINPALAVSTVPPDSPEVEELDEAGAAPMPRGGVDVVADMAGDIACCIWWGPWFEHQNLRDDRVEVFSSWLSGGTYTYTYTARATTPGTFVAPPAHAEEIYAPEVFGRSASTLVTVE